MKSKIPVLPFLDSYLESLEMFGIRPGLEATRRLMELAGNPDRDLKFLHLAGTNGKGSTGAMLERALRTAGFRTGFYSSPHLLSVVERIRVDGRAARPEVLDAMARELAKHVETLHESGIDITYFEFTTVLAAKYFAAGKPDFVVWETGMGGRLDATNVVTPILSIITNIALDHTRYLGDTPAAIAGEKAGIIKPEIPCFAGRLAQEALAVVRRRAADLDSPLTVADPPPENATLELVDGQPVQVFEFHRHRISLGLLGAVQRGNFATAFPVLEHLSARYRFDLDRALAGLSKVKWPARLQMLPGGFILDGGHNPDGAAALVSSLGELAPGEKFWIIFANFQDKDTLSTLKILAQAAKGFIFTSLGYRHRPSWPVEKLTAMLKSFSDLECLTASSARQALKLGRVRQDAGERVLIAGSLYLAGETLTIMNLADTALNL